MPGLGRRRHAFTKIGIDDGEHCGLAGPELLVKQMVTCLPLWLDGRRADAKQFADQEDWGELLPRPSLEEAILHDPACFWGCQGKACDRAAWAHSITVAAAKGRQQSVASLLLDLAKFFAQQASRGDSWLGGALPTKAGGSLRRTSALFFPSWPWGPSFQVLTAEAARLLVEGLQARHLPLSKGKSKVLIDGTDKLKLGLLQQLDLLGIDECDTAPNVGADLQLGKRRRACAVKGRLARAARRTRRGRTSIRHSATTDKLCWLGRLEFGRACRTSTPCRLRCEGRWPGSATLRGRGAAPTTQQLPSCSRFCGWAGAHSPRGVSQPTTAQRSTSWRWRRRRWVSGWIRPLLVLASWRGGHSGIATCWSSWFRMAFGRKCGSRG